MAFAAIHNQNPFVIPALFFAALLLLRWYLASRPGPYRPYAQRFGSKSIIAVSALLGICITLIPVFEAYFRLLECRVSEQYMAENIDFAHRAINVFETNRIPYWLDYATLLNQLRKQDLNAWEQDVDLSTLLPSHLQSMRNLPILPSGEPLGPLLDEAKKNPIGPYPALEIEDLMQKFKEEGFDVVYERERMLLQCWGKQRRGPHIDIWLWAAIEPGTTAPSETPSAMRWKSDAPPQLWSGEEHLAYNPRTFAHIFPLANATWLGRTVAVPRDSHAVSKGEFGRYGGSYMTPQVFRGDCFHNFFQLRYFY